MQANSPPSVADILLDRVVERLGRYRELVGQAASGFVLSHDEADEVDRLLRELELPSWCLRRDVDATRNMGAAETEHRQLELAWLYPHLFAEARQWAQLRRSERGARRRAMSQIREAMSIGK